MHKSSFLTAVSPSSPHSLQDFFDKNPALMFAKDLSGRYLWINSSFEQLFGLTGHEIVGRTDWEIFPPNQAQAFVKNDQHVLEEGSPIKFEEQARYTDGIHVSIVQKFPLRNEDGEVIGVGGIATDITDRNKAEQVLRASERQFRDAFEKSAVGMVIKDLEGRIVQLNRTYCDIVGYSKEQLLHTEYIRITHQDDRARNSDLMHKLLRGDIPSFVLEKRYVRNDGSIVWVQNSVTLLRDYRGVPDRYIALVEDISERKEAMDRLRALSARLEQVREEERAELAREVHDELGQMLTALSMDLSALSRQIVKSGSQSVPPLLKRIGAMNGIIEQAVHSVRRISMRLRPDVLDRLDLVEAIRWQAKEFSRHTGVTLRFRGPRNRLNPDQETAIGLFRITQEALTNVMRHANASEGRVDIVATTDRIVLRILDNGQGFDTLDRKKRSFGLLGMEERARMIGGTLSIEGSPGAGTTVKVEVPRSRVRL
jgi:two-component system, NarL family, sensor histidine kinase UhpB